MDYIGIIRYNGSRQVTSSPSSQQGEMYVRQFSVGGARAKPSGLQLKQSFFGFPGLHWHCGKLTDDTEQGIRGDPENSGKDRKYPDINTVIMFHYL